MSNNKAKIIPVKNENNKTKNDDPISEIVDMRLSEYNNFINVYETLKNNYVKTAAELNCEKKWNNIEYNELMQERDELIKENKKIKENNVFMMKEKEARGNKSKILIRDNLINTISLEELISKMEISMDKDYATRNMHRKKSRNTYEK